MLIRNLTDIDISEVVTMAYAMASESPEYQDFEFSVDKFGDLLEVVLIDPDKLCLVMEDEGKLVGMMIGVVMPHFFSGDRLALDLLVYVAPKYRGRCAGRQLLSRYVAWAKGRDVKQIRLGTTTGIEVERTAKLFGRCGFREIGRVFRHEG